MSVSFRNMAALLCSALVAGACGGGPQEPPPASTPTPAESTQTAKGAESTPAAKSTGRAAHPIQVGREPNQEFTVTAEDLGIHSYTTQPAVPAKSIRLVCFPNWSTVQTAPDKFDWADFDYAISRVESWGITDILYVFCATPKWAASPLEGSDASAFGPLTAQPPKNMEVWRKWVTAVAKRYKGRISGYEVWNEPSSPQFFAGTPQQMGQMTEVAYDAIKKVDSKAYVLSASAQTHRQEYYDAFFPGYLDDLKTRGWPVDGMSVHFYPAAGGDPESRVEQIRMVQDALAEAGAPAELPLWDTEVNYGVGAAGGEPDGRITGQRAAAWTAVTFLDSWRTGVRRPYWYLWAQDYYSFPGIQMRLGDPATAALNVLGLWVIGADFLGCEQDGPAVVCQFDRGGPFAIAYSTSGQAKIEVSGTVRACPVFGGQCQEVKGSIRVNETPVYLQKAR